MALLKLTTNGVGQPVRLVVSRLTQTEFKRVSALPGATAHATANPWVSFPMEPNRVTDLRNLLPDLEQTSDMLVWYAYWDHKASASILTQGTQGDHWDVSDIPFGGTLYPYQRTGVAWLRGQRRAILGDEMGLGKTLQALGAAHDADPILIVTVGLAERSVWDAHIAKYLYWREIYVCDGDRANRQRQLRAFAGASTPRGIVIINHDMLQTRFRSAYPQLYTTHWHTVIVDEAHLFQDHRSSRSQGAQKLVTKNLYLLTGTPVWSTPQSVFGLLKLIDPKRWSSFWAFVSEYCDVNVTPWSREIVGVKPDKAPDLRATLAPVVLRRLESDPVVASQLPPLRVQTLTYQLTPEQRATYRKLKNDYVVQHGADVIKLEPSTAQAFADLRRLVNDPKLLDLGMPGAKLPVINDLLDEALSEGKKVVLFTWHKDYIKLLLAWLYFEKRVGAVAIDGSLSESDRLVALRAFQQQPDVQVLVASIATASTAIDLTAASVAIFAEGSYVATHIEQAIKRLHRHGQHVATMIYRLQAEHTVEQALWEVVDDRAAQASSMLAFTAFRHRALALEVEG